MSNIKDILPHREPILLVDEVIESKAFESIHARRFFPENDPVFQGHFPGFPVMPGVLGIEALAQTGAALINISEGLGAKETTFAFMSVDSAKFRLPVLPGCTLDLHVEVEQQRGTVFRFIGKAMLGDKVATEAKFTAKLNRV